jgi:hypothetical protein
MITDIKLHLKTVPIQVNVSPTSERLQLLEAFPAWDGKNIEELKF